MTIIRPFSRKRESSGHPSALWRKIGFPLSGGTSVGMCTLVFDRIAPAIHSGPIESSAWTSFGTPAVSPVDVSFLHAEPVLLHHLLVGVAQEERNELSRRRRHSAQLAQDGSDGSDRLRRDFRRQCQRW